MQTRFDAIIIGAGPAGSTAAIRLAGAGWSVALIEKQPFPRRKVCGECLAASNLPLLDALEVGAKFHALAGSELRRVALMFGTESICAELPAYASQTHPWGKALGREHLDAMLLARAAEAGAHVLQPWSVQAVQRKAGAYQCIVHAPGSKVEVRLDAAVIIAAHGSWGAGLAGDRSTHKRPGGSDLFALKANFTHAELEQGLLPVLAFRGGYGGMVQGGHGVLTLACCIRRDHLSAYRRQMQAKSAGDAVQSYLMTECAGVRRTLSGAKRQGKWLSVGPIRPGIHMQRDGGRFFSVGNAAGEAHPIIGEGMSMAMQSAWLACEHLIAAPRVLSDAQLQRHVLQDYAQAWRAHFAHRMNLAAAFAHAAMRPALVRTCLPILRAWPGLLTRAACWSGKVSQSCFLPQASAETTALARSMDGCFPEFENGENA
jgi:flavin-dependent dehydrogenase